MDPMPIGEGCPRQSLQSRILAFQNIKGAFGSNILANLTLQIRVNSKFQHLAANENSLDSFIF